jgi:UDP-N-acetylglucosamine--N-acetylmuramyl-(pentapeptide) pyrophosphoryl-undecaprenol N-acetylglucosamine transferase
VTVLIAGGGTGGHVFPMIAVGDAVRAAQPGAKVVYAGTARGIEARVIPERGDDLELLDVLPLRGGGLSGFARGLARAAAVLPASRALVKRLRPDVVLSVGGYAAGPVSLAARTLGVPVTLLEPNSVLGLANRLLAPLCRRAYVAFPETARHFRPSVVLDAGVPLRRSFEPAEYQPTAGVTRVLVLGGSQGAAALNAAIPEALALCAGRVAGLEVVHQTGKGRDADVRGAYDRHGLAGVARVVPFLDDVAVQLGRADVVIQRAGASSMAELCAVGRAALLVPFPFAADDHQLYNARSLERAGGGVAIPQAEATPLRIAAEVERLARDPELRTRMARAARERGRPDAARRVADDLLALAAGRGQGSQQETA